MSYSTKKISLFRRPNGPSDLAFGISKLTSRDGTAVDDLEIKDLTVVIEDGTSFIVPVIFDFLVSRYLEGRRDSQDAKALRLYFDFLDVNPSLEWDVGSLHEHERPLKKFALFLEELYFAGQISGTTATNYFRCVSRFYKYHLKLDYPFKNGAPVLFEDLAIKTLDNDPFSHINGREIKIQTTSSRPNIPSGSKSTILKPLSKERSTEIFMSLSKYGSTELMLMSTLSVSSGLRASEIADLRVDMISGYSGEEQYRLRLGPSLGHSTKKGSSMSILVEGRVIEALLDYVKSPRYLKRLDKDKFGDRANVFLTKNGKPYSGKTISTLFGQFITEHFGGDEDIRFHLFRVTFGVNVMKAAIDAGWSRNDCLSFTRRQMRHKNLKDTFLYLEYWTASEARLNQLAINEALLEYVFDSLERRSNG
jgi:integrase